jgi:thiol-disulfide isomerase/thioredoxin
VARVLLLLLWTLLAAGQAGATELRVWSEGEREPFALDSLARGQVSLLGQRGRVVLVHFFATWCEPCRDEMVSLQRLAGRFAPEHLGILAINVGEPDSRVRRFFDSLPVDFPILLDRDKTVTKAWQVATLPTTFVLDRTLTPRFRVEGDLDWAAADANEKLAALIDDQPAAGHDDSTTAASHGGEAR